MLDFLPIVPALPLAGFVALLAGRRIGHRATSLIGVGSVALSMLAAIALAILFLSHRPDGGAHVQVLWTWMQVGSFSPQIALRLDALSLAFVLVVTIVAFLILLYSVQFMADDEGYTRFFAYLDLFVGSMLLLVLADNLLLLYLAWEAVGLCSYLLIGFWYRDPDNCRAARKAFVVTRFGDAAFFVALLLLLAELGTLSVADILHDAAQQWPMGTALPVAAAALLLAGAVGKSAQLPLQVWLPDAMAGPTPVSAMIHAATMVTAGVYLIARMHVLFELAPVVHHLVALIGGLTLVLGGFAAVAQTDIKRVIAYSTISQIGYMFLALGVGAWSAGLYHFLTHAFFKSLMFLGAGVIIYGLEREHNLFRMGGLRRVFPLTFWSFLAAALALTALPPTGGFASKDSILYYAWVSPQGGGFLYALGLAGAFLTGLYTFRMLFLAFCGPLSREISRRPGWAMQASMATLAIFCFVPAGLSWPRCLGGRDFLGEFLSGVLPSAAGTGSTGLELGLEVASLCAAGAGILVAWLIALRQRAVAADFAAQPVGRALHQLWQAGWGFDWLYDRLFVRPYVWLARGLRYDVIDMLMSSVAWAFQLANRVLSFLQNGRVRWYAAGVMAGAVILLGLAVLL